MGRGVSGGGIEYERGEAGGGIEYGDRAMRLCQRNFRMDCDSDGLFGKTKAYYGTVE